MAVTTRPLMPALVFTIQVKLIAQKHTQVEFLQNAFASAHAAHNDWYL